MRLTDANMLYDILADKLTWLMKYGDDVYIEVGDIIRNAIDDMPAYDMDRIVEQLKESSKTYCEEYGQREGNLYLFDAIEIVRKGGEA